MEANDPGAPVTVEAPQPLSSPAQADRGHELKGARRILIVIGLLMAAVNGFALYNLPNEIGQTIQFHRIPPADVPAFREAVMTSGSLIYGSGTFLGLLFVVFGLIVSRFPLLITTTSLALYIIATAAYAMLVPATLRAGLLIKVIIIIALFRAIRAARAFQSHARKATLDGERPG